MIHEFFLSVNKIKMAFKRLYGSAKSMKQECIKAAETEESPSSCSIMTASTHSAGSGYLTENTGNFWIGNDFLLLPRIFFFFNNMDFD